MKAQYVSVTFSTPYEVALKVFELARQMNKSNSAFVTEAIKYYLESKFAVKEDKDRG